MLWGFTACGVASRETARNRVIRQVYYFNSMLVCVASLGQGRGEIRLIVGFLIILFSVSFEATVFYFLPLRIIQFLLHFFDLRIFEMVLDYVLGS